MTVEWSIVTGEYPPHCGGVADYSALIAHRLVAEGDRVNVWAPWIERPSDVENEPAVHRLRHGFGIRSLATLGRGLDRTEAPRRVLVQYVPQAFGYRGMNVAFCLWLARRRERVWTMFHEVVFPRLPGQPARHRLLAEVTRIMARLVARASERVFVSTPAWAEVLPSIAPGAPAPEWLPVPSNIARASDRDEARSLRDRYGFADGPLVGHFGSCRSVIADQLAIAIPALLGHAPDASMVLIGDGGTAMRQRLVRTFPALSHRVWSTGSLAARDVSLHLQACDVVMQPFVEGVTTRRGSVMAALAHGVATVTTSGRLTEPVWQQRGAVELAPAGEPRVLASVTSTLLADRRRRERIAEAGRTTYDALFDVRHTIAALRRPRSRTIQPAEVLVS